MKIPLFHLELLLDHQMTHWNFFWIPHLPIIPLLSLPKVPLSEWNIPHVSSYIVVPSPSIDRDVIKLLDLLDISKLLHCFQILCLKFSSLISRFDRDVVKLLDLLDVSKLLHSLEKMSPKISLYQVSSVPSVPMLLSRCDQDIISFQMFKFPTFFVPVAPCFDREVVKLLPFSDPQFPDVAFCFRYFALYNSCTTTYPKYCVSVCLC